MEPNVDGLPLQVRALYQALTQGARRETPDAATLPLLSHALPADLHALLYAWTYYGQPSRNSLRTWNVFETWDFGLSIEPVTEKEMRRICEVLAPGSRTSFPSPPYVQLGADGGGHMTVFAGITNGATVTFGPEDGEDWDGIDGLLWRLAERAEFEPEPLLAPFLGDDPAE